MSTNEAQATQNPDEPCRLCGKVNQSGADFCDGDGNRNNNKKNKHCGRCKTATYCSRECQKADWKEHSKKDCVAYFSLAELRDPNNVLAAKALNNKNTKKIPTGSGGAVKYYDFYPRKRFYDISFDRACVAGPHAQKSFEGTGDFYVATDIAQLVFEQVMPNDAKGKDPLVVAPGQYYSNDYGNNDRNTHKKTWKRFDSGNEAPGNVGGFHQAVIDTQQPGSSWTLSANYVSFPLPVCQGQQSQSMKGPSFAAIARTDYKGFKSNPPQAAAEAAASDEEGADDGDQCRGQLLLKEFPNLKTGKFRIRDLANGQKGDQQTFTDGCLECAMDGYYPINVHYDAQGKMDLILVKLAAWSEDDIMRAMMQSMGI